VIPVPTREYNKAGHNARDYYVAGEDPCGYVEEEVNPNLLSINSSVQEALQRVTEISESDADPSVKAKAWQTYNLAREFAATANRINETSWPLLAARVRRVVESL